MNQSDKQFDKLAEEDNSCIVSVDTGQYLDLAVVEQVVGDIVDYVVRKEDLSKLSIPIDQTLPHLRSKQTETLNSCTEEYCSKGCVCSSLSEKVLKRHCGKEECMFHCICKTRLLNSLRALPHRNTLIDSYHAKRLVESDLSETESPKKIPKQTEVPKKNMRDYGGISSGENQAVIEKPILSIGEDGAVRKSGENNGTGRKRIQFSEMKAKRRNLNITDREKLSKICKGREKPIHFIDSFVWCTVHKRYSCMCHGRAFDVRTNNLLWVPTNIGLSERNVQPHQLFDSEDDSARTFGSVYDYRERNRSFLFCEKRSVEIKNEVVSNSNGFIKIELPPPCVDLTDAKTIIVTREPNRNPVLSQPAYMDPKMSAEDGIPNRGSVAKKLLAPDSSLPVDRFITVVRTPEGGTRSCSGKTQTETVSKKSYRSILPRQPESQIAAAATVPPGSGSGKIIETINMTPHGSILPRQTASKVVAATIVRAGSGSGKITSLVMQRAPNRMINPLLPVMRRKQQVKVIMHDISSDSSDEGDERLPKYGLLCLNGTLGYIPLKEYSEERLVFGNPLQPDQDVTVNGVQEGSDWLNQLFSSREVLDPLEDKPSWVVLKRALLKNHRPFCWDRFVSNPPVRNSTCCLLSD